MMTATPERALSGILSLDTDGTVKFYTKISSGNGGFSDLLSDSSTSSVIINTIIQN